MEINEKFTIYSAIKIQFAQLARWESILKPEIYKKLDNWAKSTNGYAKTGHDIRRGTDLDNFVHNNLMK